MAIGFRNIIGSVLAVLMIFGLVYLILQPKEFDVVALNKGDRRICDVVVSFKGFPSFSFGDLAPSESVLGQSGFLMHRGPWPSEVVVKWRECGDDQDVTRTVPVDAPLSYYSDENLQLVVEFHSGEVGVYPRVIESLEKGLNFRYSE